MQNANPTRMYRIPSQGGREDEFPFSIGWTCYVSQKVSNPNETPTQS